MSFQQLLNKLTIDTLGSSGALELFAPELALCITIVALMLGRLFGVDRWVPGYWIALVGTLAGFLLAWLQFWDLSATAQPPVEFFTGLLVYDRFTVFFRLFLLLFLVLVIALTVLSGIPDQDDGPDFYTLLLGSVVGMMLMASANHLLILFLGVEMASVPSFVMVAFLKGRRQSSEAALKFVVYGAGAAGVMLYGISLLAGMLGTAEFGLMAERSSALLAGQESLMSSTAVRTIVLAVMLILVGIAFKLSVFPFHFWCPDAFQGASAEVAGFLSVASKAAAFALLVRLCVVLSGSQPGELSRIYLALGVGIGVIAAATATYGNLAAYAQTNMKRLLAYSTIAHAGYMLLAVSALMVFLNAPESSGLTQAQIAAKASRAIEGLLYYLGVYLFMNLGAFAIVALIRNQIFSEEIDDYGGLANQAPVLAVAMGVCMFSLVGMPPFGGFVGKLMIFYSLFDAGSVHPIMYALLVIGGANTVFSLFYYVRVLKAMFIEPRPAGAPTLERPAFPVAMYVTVIIAAPIVVLGIHVQMLSDAARNVALVFFQ